VSLFLLSLTSVFSTEYKTPPAVLYPEKYTQWTRSFDKSRMGLIDIPFYNEVDGTDDNVHLYRLDLVGNSDYERGVAQGSLMAKEIKQFVEVELSKYYMSFILSIDLSNYPEPLQKILRVIQVKGALAAPEIMMKGMAWVYEQEKQYMPNYLLEEMDGVADGMCSTIKCNATEWRETIRYVNMLPELIKMACTAFGAWGTATPSGKLIQNRALDFGGGPFGNYTIVSVYRGEDLARSFMTLTFPGFVGVITGVAQNGIGISEKFGDEHPGAYDGEPDVFVLRDILQLTKNRQDAEAYMASVRRTWAMYVGVGDFETQQMDIVVYQQASSIPYTDVTMPSVTSQPYLQNIVYVDKHGQPSDDNPSVPDALYTPLNDFNGQITLDTARTIIQYHRSGDVHIAQYDFGSNAVQVAIGRINKYGQYGPVDGTDMNVWKAYNRPFVRFSLDDLWAGK